MSSTINELWKSNEAEFVHKHEAELIEKLRRQLEVERAAAGIEQSGVVSAELALLLAELGIAPASLPVLHLVPLVKVAWASGAVEPEERQLIELAARQAGVGEETEAWALVQELLRTPPPAALEQAALRYLAAAVPAGERDSLLRSAQAVAAATGGLFGVFGNVEKAERDALAELARRLEVG